MRNKKYQPLTLPKLSWEKSESSPTFGKLIVQPLEPGFGITFGNSLRRVILSSIEGSAVTAVMIKGVNNEYSTIKGVIEDVLQIVLNIKQIAIKNDSGDPGTMKLKASGEGPVTVGDIVADEHLELLNTDHVIAHLATDGELEIELFVEPGRGYQHAQWPQGVALQADGKIYIDSMFSPIKKVEFNIEKIRIGQSIDYDKLILKIHTNGAVAPQDVIHYGTSVLRTQLEHFLTATEIPFNEMETISFKHFIAKIFKVGC